MKHIKKFEVFESKINESVELVAPIVGVLTFLVGAGYPFLKLKEIWKEALEEEPKSTTVEEIKKEAGKLDPAHQEQLFNSLVEWEKTNKYQ